MFLLFLLRALRVSVVNLNSILQRFVIKLDKTLTPADFLPQLERFWTRSAECIDAVERSVARRGPVSGVHQSRPLHRARLDRVDARLSIRLGALAVRRHAATTRFLQLGRDRTVAHMAPHVTHIGVHDHGFNNVSTYGNLWRLMNEGRIAENKWERNFYELALKASGAVQAARWAKTADGSGYIYSFNGPHSLFVDTIRSCRSLALAHQLGHLLTGRK